MRVIGVIDLWRGRAAHARGGSRERYQPVERAAGATIDGGDAVALARVYIERLAVPELYVADLGAIVDGLAHDALTAALLAVGSPVWLDAGIASVAAAEVAADAGAGKVVVGLETLGSLTALDAICRTIGGDRVAFSLDLRAGEPIYAPGSAIARVDAPTLAARVAGVGVETVIVLDLARVGAAGGPPLASVERVRTAAPGVELVAGGGVRGLADLARLADAGCDGALVASALHDGRLDAADVAVAAQWRGGAGRGGVNHAW